MKWWKKMTTFLTEVRAEMKKVTFPSRQEVMSMTVVVIITSVIFAVFLWLSDIVILKAYQGLFKVLGS
ncbi:MAG TPA: preprotein translocase subunit SecE [Thermoanaerobaculia bacterium]|nr:preprotein translocase subunit SecE [Thermoanaerobaculia bacterium]